MQFFRSLKSLQLIFLAYLNDPKNLNSPFLVHKRILQNSFPFPIKWWTKLMDELGHVERSCVYKVTLVVEQCPTPISSTDPFKPTTVGSRKLRSGHDDSTLTRYCSCANIKHIGESTNHRCAHCCCCGQTSEQCGRVGDSWADLRLLSKSSTQNKWGWRRERGNVTTSAQNSLTKRSMSMILAGPAE